MKTLYIFLGCLLLTFAASAQRVNVVFDITSPDTAIQASTIRHVKMMAAAYPESNFEVVIYSGAYPMVLKDRSTVAADVVSLADQKNVAFTICAMTLKRHNIDESVLLKGVQTVPDGIMQIVLKQQQGWAYIKEAN
jgi:uncharacterized protein